VSLTQPAYSPRATAIGTELERMKAKLQDMRLVQSYGTVVDVQGPLARVAAPDFRVGDMCEFLMSEGEILLGEVIGLQGNYSLVTPLGSIEGIGQGTLVRKRGEGFTFPFSNALLGRVLDGLGNVIGPPLPKGTSIPMPVRNAPPDPMDRAPIDTPMPTGLRVIDSTMTLARGQRVMVVVVAASAEKPALERLYAANTATAVAEGFRDQGKSVLLVIDSLTRVARAMREVGLAAGEPPTRRGYPASVFALLPELIERPGPASTGEITAIYSVLSEGDIANDPIAEETRSLVDGHIVLDPKVFAAGRFPAINVTDSLSRLMNDVVSPDHTRMNTVLRNVLTKYQEIELLIQVGEYRRGQDEIADRAYDLYPQVIEFLSQPGDQGSHINDTLNWMEHIFG